MKVEMRRLVVCALLLRATPLCIPLRAQVYSPLILRKGQPDSTDLPALARGIFGQAGATTPREKAEAIWRFFLTDGRFVKPGMIYHIAGWAYEEPGGEVLDPVKLLNSYGFGLCYHVAPLLESVYKAGGFADARVWFLTGHTVAEVFYDGGYHYFDSDMMGYNPIGTSGPLKQRPVASVHQIEQDGSIITGKLVGPKQADIANVDGPWYPADVRAHAIGDLAELFTSWKDNRVFPYRRYAAGHTMDFVLRPGERIVRYFHPEPAGLYYLPYRFDGTAWQEFPQEIEQYKIRTTDGPRSQKDARTWATGVQEYRPPISAAMSAVYRMPSAYVIIDASFQMLASDPVTVETSVDDGQAWTPATVTGKPDGEWTAIPAVLTKSEHGSRNAVSGTYGYLVRITSSSPRGRTGGAIRDLVLCTRFQLNPRTLPELSAGNNAMGYSSASAEHLELPATLPRLTNAGPVVSGGQTYFANIGGQPGRVVYKIQAPDGEGFSGFDAGARFLDLRDGLAPDKFTAEIRKVPAWPTAGETQGASLAWSLSAEGPWRTIWVYTPQLRWKDGELIDRTLRWPEVDRQVRDLPKGTRSVYVRYELQGIAMDTPRLAAVREGLHSRDPIEITHVWRQNGERHELVKRILGRETRQSYPVEVSPGAAVTNEALILENPAPHEIASHFAARDAPVQWDPASDFWRDIPATEISTDNVGKLHPASRTEVRSRWTAGNLYFQFTCRYEELYLRPGPSRTTETNKLWNWDVAEVFLGSNFENIRRYREFEMSPQGEWLDLDIDLSRATPADGWTWNSGFKVTASIDEKNKIWYGAMRIPYSSIDSRAATAGNLLRVNFYREQGPPARQVEAAWSPTMQRTYHVPERFGVLKLMQ
jgi:hypothetical protein